MKNYITLDNEYFEILIPKDFLEYGNKVLDYSTKKIKEYLEFFKEKSYGEKIKGAFLTSREDFVKRITDIKSDEENMPPDWATGCFYGGETQILMDINDPDDVFYVLVHETFHLLFSKFVYDKNNWERIIWLDEALACNFDDTTEKIINNGYFLKIIGYYRKVNNLPKMSNFDFTDGIFNNDDWNGYELFKIVGRYLIETMNKDELYKYINDYERIISDGDRILLDSIKYFSEKYKYID